MSQRHTLKAMIFGDFFVLISTMLVLCRFLFRGMTFSHANSWVLGGQSSKFTTLKTIQMIVTARDLSKVK
jgi:hypothetical protein